MKATDLIKKLQGIVDEFGPDAVVSIERKFDDDREDGDGLWFALVAGSDYDKDGLVKEREHVKGHLSARDSNATHILLEEYQYIPEISPWQ